MVNCNPETVSTDYDTSDRLYFEPLTLEHVLEILRVEQENGTLHGVIVQFGGQTPLKLADALHDAGIPILGTTPDAIDLAEDRERFQALLHRLGLRQPVNGIARSPAEANGGGEGDRLPAGHPPVLRPRRPRDGDRPRRRRAHPLHPRRRAGLGRHPRPPRPLPLERHRGRRRRHLRRQRRPHRRRHGAHRGGRRPLRRLRLLAPALVARRGDGRRPQAPDRAPWRSPSASSA